MNRDHLIGSLEKVNQWDIIVIGGGATGLGAGVEAASRGYNTLLLEQHDLSKGTSSRSTKLVHGGVRYLQQGNISLVLEALHERDLLIRNAPHIVHNQAFIVPNYEWWSGPFYGVGLKVYDLLAGRMGLGPSKHLSKTETLGYIPTLEPARLRGGVIYYDGQFDDSRLAIHLAQTIEDLGGTPLNYTEVTGLLKTNGMVSGVVVTDQETGSQYQIEGRVVINATGMFADRVLKMDDPGARNIITLSQGIHIVLDRHFLPGDTAVMVPQTEDGRVLFAVPWNGKVVVGTTDTPVTEATLEPQAQQEEIEFILSHAARYLSTDPGPQDVRSIFAGIRPLVDMDNQKNTAAISRDHHLMISHSGLVTIAGGKWTTYRLMGEDTINQAVMIAGLEKQKSETEALHIHGWKEGTDRNDHLHVYGSDVEYLKTLMKSEPELAGKIHPALPYLKAEVVWAVRNEMARRVEDVLSRRTRALLLDARVSVDCAPVVARIMARELGYDASWQQRQITEYTELANRYVFKP